MEEILYTQRKKRRSNKIKKKNVVFSVISLVILISYTVCLFFILGWGLVSSFKNQYNFTLYPGKFFPDHSLYKLLKSKGLVDNAFQYYFGNYINQFKHVKYVIPQTGESVGLIRMFIYSVYWGAGSAFLNVFTTALVAYVCSRFAKRMFSKIIYIGIVFVMSIPLIGTAPAQLEMINRFQLYDNLLLVPAMKISFTSSYFLVFYSIFQGIPTSYREAAEIDGAGHWTIYFRIVMPMASSTLAAVFILLFITYWNDYSTPMMYLPSYPVLARGLYEITIGQQSRDPGVHTGIKLAAAYTIALPPFIFFIVFREKIMGNIAIGGLKG